MDAAQTIEQENEPMARNASVDQHVREGDARHALQTHRTQLWRVEDFRRHHLTIPQQQWFGVKGVRVLGFKGLWV